MARLGLRTLREMTGRVDLLDSRAAVGRWKAEGIDLARVLHQAPVGHPQGLWNSERQDHGLDAALDHTFIAAAAKTLEGGPPTTLEATVRNVNRSLGAMLSGHIARRFGHEGLPDGALTLRLNGTAGQSLGAFLSRGVTLELTGDANDYVGKSLSGGRIIVRAPPESRRDPTANIIVGNTVLYGAIAGEAYFEGVAGERFAVRNSGAVAVVEGLGDHGCEYMTGGVVVVLGETGRNFAAGMSGGVAYVYDPEGKFAALCNPAMVTLEPVAESSGAESDDAAPRPEAPSVYDSGMGDPLRFDSARLRLLIERHHRYTGSARAAEILADWATRLNRFVKVTPDDYRRALLAARQSALQAVAAE
jgi:glutamate synthase (NADPH/NADH) large chain